MVRFLLLGVNYWRNKFLNRAKKKGLKGNKFHLLQRVQRRFEEL
jgi:hypothetical protein